MLAMILIIIELTLWITIGIITIGMTIETEDKSVPLFSYVICWGVLLLEIINKLINKGVMVYGQ